MSTHFNLLSFSWWFSKNDLIEWNYNVFFSSQNLVQSNKDWRGTNEGCECSTELNLQCSWSGALSMSAGLQHMHWCQTLTAISKLRQVSLPRIRSRGWSETVEVSKNGRRSRIMGGRCGKSANTITGHALPATSRLTEMKNKLFVSRLPISSALAVFWSDNNVARHGGLQTALHQALQMLPLI